MGGSSRGERFAGDVQRVEAQHQKELFSLGAPGMRLALDDMLKDLGKPGQEPDSVRRAFDEASRLQGQQFDQQAEAMPLTAHQQILQSGARVGAGVEEGTSQQMLMQLEKRRRSSARALEQQRIDAGLQQRDYDLSQILGIAHGGLSSSFGYSQNALAATRYMAKDPWQGALSGAAAGASAGSAAGGWGAVIGGVLGGAAGYWGT